MHPSPSRRPRPADPVPAHEQLFYASTAVTGALLLALCTSIAVAVPLWAPCASSLLTVGGALGFIVTWR
jgi:hypothetical protein